MKFRSRLTNFLALGSILGGGASSNGSMWRNDTTGVPRRKTSFKYQPPRSMTIEEKEYYDKHKTLAGLYK